MKTQSCNYAVSGDDSNDCIKLLNSGIADADLKQADVISISIGSNDLLLPFIQIVLDNFGIDPDMTDKSNWTDGFTMPQIDFAKLQEYFKQMQKLFADNETLHAQAAAFPEKLQTILSLLHAKAPKAEIYITNIYNPFHSIPMLGDLAQTYIDEINQTFTADAPDYTLVDVYTPFQQNELTNIQFDLSNFDLISMDFSKLDWNSLDPHPSAEGHKTIANLLIQSLKQAHAPKTAALNSVKSGSEHKLTAKINLPAKTDGCQILYASSKNGNYKTLGVTSKKTFQTNSKHLKRGKTYYVKTKSYRTIKGVTYYGKTSSAKKIKIK